MTGVIEWETEGGFAKQQTVDGKRGTEVLVSRSDTDDNLSFTVRGVRVKNRKTAEVKVFCVSDPKIPSRRCRKGGVPLEIAGVAFRYRS